MVLLTIKGSQNPDEFTFDTPAVTTVGDVHGTIIDMLNHRHRVKLQLHSAPELVAAAVRASPEHAPKLEGAISKIQAEVKDARKPVPAGTPQLQWNTFRDLAVTIFPGECVHAEGPKAAIEQLYMLHDNPDIDDDYRLHVYHCRAMIDPDYRPKESIDAAHAGLWFNSRLLTPTESFATLCSGNDKSRITIKVAPSGAAAVAPSKEPRLTYNDQRELKRHLQAKADTYRQLEDSELRGLVTEQSRGKVWLPGAMPNGKSVDVSIAAATQARLRAKDLTSAGIDEDASTGSAAVPGS